MKIGVDLGGTRLHVALIKDNRILKDIKTTHKRRDKDYLLKELVDNISKLNNKNVKGIAIGVAGFVKNGIMLYAANLPSLNNFNLKKYLEKRFKVKTVVENDVHCFAIRQQKLNKAKNLVAITLGTGVGGGIIIDGKLYTGQGAAGEIGHMVIKDGGEKEPSGRIGTFEAYCSGRAIENRYFKLTKKRLNAVEILKLKDKNSKRVIEETGYYLGIALANIALILNPDMIIVGGSVSNINEIFPIAEKEMKKRILKGMKVRLIRSTVRGSTVLGAASLIH